MSNDLQHKTKEITEEIQRFSALLNRLNEDELISNLSNQGVLPGYSFPLHTQAKKTKLIKLSPHRHSRKEA